MNRAVKYVLALVLALMTAGAFAGVYRWVDKQGVVHYTDMPPPQGAKLVPIESTPTDPAAVVARKEAAQKRVQSYKKGRAKQAKTAAKAEQKHQKAEKACALAQARVQSLDGIDRVRQPGADGKVTYLSGDDLAAFKAKQRARAAKLCAAANK